MPQLEHPAISQVNRTGYPNVVNQPEHFGKDIFGVEILLGDDYVEYDGDLILLDNLQRYLAEHMDFEFKTAD
ncbi:hypothetical protein V7150_16260 [Neobacillus drentensis]|uniref:YqaI family protein n=1 Tax=Neobacillus drentensis TaxID=220684 RepID=UPI002FFF332D